MKVADRRSLYGLITILGLWAVGRMPLAHAQDASTDPRPAPPRAEGEEPFDRLVIRAATLIDGTGAPPRGPVDIVVERNRIAAVVTVGAAAGDMRPGGRPQGAAREIDAAGMYVLPGFVDLHLHSVEVPKTPEAEYVYKLWLAHGIAAGRGVPFASPVFSESEKQRSARNEITAPRRKDGRRTWPQTRHAGFFEFRSLFSQGGHLHADWGRNCPRPSQQPGVLRLHPRRGQAVRRALVRERLGLQPLGLQDVRVGGSGPRPDPGHEPEPHEAAPLHPHPLRRRLRGLESGWFDGEKLSPIGRNQQSAQRWLREHGPPGVMHTPVALLVDFYSGWSFPRHLYPPHVYRVWGNLPYSDGDYLTDAILDLVYPSLTDRDMDRLRKEVRRIAAALRTRVALRQKRASTGQLDAKATIRPNLKHGNVPIELRHHQRTLKPRLVVICDISTSMRYCSELMLSLIFAMQDQISKTSAFAFIDHLKNISRRISSRMIHARQSRRCWIVCPQVITIPTWETAWIIFTAITWGALTSARPGSW